MRKYARCRVESAPRGEVPEWSNGPDSKSGVRVSRTVGSNPTLSARTKKPLNGAFLVLGEGMGFRTLFDQIGLSRFGEAAPQAPLNPTLSASKSGLRVVSVQRLSKAFLFPGVT